MSHTQRQPINAMLSSVYAANQHPQVGEVRLIRSQRAMCINSFIQYGGGSGPLWAVEHERVQFALKSHRGYIEGVCRRVHPKSKSVTLEITKGPTWGILAMATFVTIKASEFVRYHPASEAGTDFVFQSQQWRSQIHAQEMFRECMLDELKAALSNEYQEQLAAVLGSTQHNMAVDLIKAYLTVSEEVNKSKGHCLHMPSRALKDARQRLHKLFAALEATEATTAPVAPVAPQAPSNQ